MGAGRLASAAGRRVVSVGRTASPDGRRLVPVRTSSGRVPDVPRAPVAVLVVPVAVRVPTRLPVVPVPRVVIVLVEIRPLVSREIAERVAVRVPMRSRDVERTAMRRLSIT